MQEYAMLQKYITNYSFVIVRIVFFYSKGSHCSPTCHRVQANLVNLGNLEKGKPGKQWNLVKNDIPGKNRENFLKEFFVSHIF